MAGQVINPQSSNLGDGIQVPNAVIGKQGEQLVADVHGKHYNANVRTNVYKFNKTAVTIPVIANNLVSVFTLWNPPASGVLGEIISVDVGQVLATTVVDTLGWYFSIAALTAAGTFTTPSVAGTNHFSGRVGDTPGNKIQPYSAYTHSGTPARVDIVGAFGAVTDAVVMPGAMKVYDGTFILPPGIAMSLAMSTAAGTTSGLDVGVNWAEFPYAAS